MILLGALATAIPYTDWTGGSYSPLNHFVSELGEVGRSQLAVVFNFGIVAGGFTLMLFLILLARRMTGRHRMGLAVLGVLAGVGGILVGLFPMNTHAVHRMASDLFFLTCWLVAADFSLWLSRTRSPAFPRWLLAPAVVSIAVDIVFVVVYATAYHPVDPDAHILSRSTIWVVPLLEWASLLSLLFWITCTALVLVRRRNR